MLVGDANQRERRGSGMKSQTCFRCYTGPNFQGDDAAPCADAQLDTEHLPTGPCHGIRSNVLYPTYVSTYHAADLLAFDIGLVTDGAGWV